jgi:hypothetical protein
MVPTLLRVTGKPDLLSSPPDAGRRSATKSSSPLRERIRTVDAEGRPERDHRCWGGRSGRRAGDRIAGHRADRSGPVGRAQGVQAERSGRGGRAAGPLWFGSPVTSPFSPLSGILGPDTVTQSAGCLADQVEPLEPVRGCSHVVPSLSARVIAGCLRIGHDFETTGNRRQNGRDCNTTVQKSTTC